MAVKGLREREGVTGKGRVKWRRKGGGRVSKLNLCTKRPMGKMLGLLQTLVAYDLKDFSSSWTSDLVTSMCLTSPHPLSAAK